MLNYKTLQAISQVKKFSLDLSTSYHLLQLLGNRWSAGLENVLSGIPNAVW
jgi:hypothetical protein